MNCTDFRLLLHAQLDGELDAASNLQLEQHLQACASCAAAKRSLQSLRSLLPTRELRYRAPDSLKRDVRQFIQDMKNEKSSPTRELQWLWKWLAFGATAFAVLTLVFRLPGISGRDPLLAEVISSHVRSLQVEHLTDVASSDQHTVKPWFDGKLDFAPGVKDFAAQGFPLVGGMLDYVGQRNVAALVYRRNKHLINVFVWPATQSVKLETVNRRGFSIVRGDVNGMHYCLVSDLNEKELNELAELVAK